MNELALFAGAGGGILGGHLLGWRTVCAVEIEDYPRRVLLQRQRDGILPRFPIWDDIKTFDGRPWKGRIDIVSGGFPCQDISAAGKGAGIEGERSGLWGEMARVVGEVRPRFVFVENSPMLTSRGLGRVLGDLASMGYDARWCVLGADDAGAPHRRKRIWILAYSKSNGSGRNTGKLSQKNEQQASERQEGRIREPVNASKRFAKMADTNGARPQRADVRKAEHRTTERLPSECRQITWWDTDPADLPNTKDNRLLFGERSGSNGKRPGGIESDRRADPAEHEIRERRSIESPMGRVAHGVATDVDSNREIVYNYTHEREQLSKAGSEKNEECKVVSNLRSDREKASSSSQRQGQDEQLREKSFENMPEMSQKDSRESWGLGAWEDAIIRGKVQDLRKILYSNTLSRNQKEFLVWFGSMQGGERTAECFEAMGKSPRVATGVKSRVDRLKAIGNGQVPAVAALAFTILSEGLT